MAYVIKFKCIDHAQPDKDDWANGAEFLDATDPDRDKDFDADVVGATRGFKSSAPYMEVEDGLVYMFVTYPNEEAYVASTAKYREKLAEKGITKRATFEIVEAKTT
jgi:hypothetical protein|tara:strand:- start:25811 stop:26128 length:318 start_codon:yes stop_codon:yes gene_type:complete